MKYLVTLRRGTGKLSRYITESTSLDLATRSTPPRLELVDIKALQGPLALLDEDVPKFFEIAQILKHIALMTSNGLTVAESVELISATSTPRQMNFAGKVCYGLSAGLGLAGSIDYANKAFGDAYGKQIGVAESSSALSDNLNAIADQITTQNKIVKKLHTALIYPGFVLIVTMIVLVVMLIYVVPQFTAFLSGFGEKLPMITQIIVNLSNMTIKLWPLMLFLVLGIVVLYRRVISRVFRIEIDRFKLSIPIIGKLYLFTDLSVFCRNLGSMLNSGMPEVFAVETACYTIQNTYLARKFEVVPQMLSSDADDLAKIFSITGCVTDIVTLQLIEVGNSSGELPKMLLNAANVKDDDCEELVKRLVAAIDPILMVIIATIVGTIMLAMYIPMISSISQIK